MGEEKSICKDCFAAGDVCAPDKIVVNTKDGKSLITECDDFEEKPKCATFIISETNVGWCLVEVDGITIDFDSKHVQYFIELYQRFGYKIKTVGFGMAVRGE